MKRAWWCGLLLAPLLAMAAPEDDYAQQWPIALSDGDAGAYRVMLDASVYAAAQSPVLRDVDVVNADGMTVPAQLFPPEGAVEDTTRRVPVRWFALPQRLVDTGGDIAMAVERDADGRVRRIESRVSDATGAVDAGAGSWLVDASALDRPLEALWLDWTPGGGIDRLYRIEGSDDLRGWRVLHGQVPLVDLEREGEHLRQRRVPVGERVKYLRLTPAGGSGVMRITGMQVELRDAGALPQPEWLLLEGRVVEERGERHYEFTSDSRFPVTTADVGLAGNSTGQWTLYSRDDPATPWVRRAGPWISYRIGAASKSAPQALHGTVRDRHWKLVASATLPQAPMLHLGWHPETLVFVAQGAAPYRLVAGSARAARSDAPLAQSLQAIRGTHGKDWQPPVATLGAPQPLAGDRALQPGPRDWRNWLLWGLLVAGALLVAAFAFSLLRQSRAPDA